jgi:hypothetical protein
MASIQSRMDHLHEAVAARERLSFAHGGRRCTDVCSCTGHLAHHFLSGEGFMTKVHSLYPLAVKDALERMLRLGSHSTALPSTSAFHFPKLSRQARWDGVLAPR